MNIILTKESATFIVDSNPHTIARNHKRFPALLEAYRENDEAKLRKILDALSNVKSWADKNATGKIKIVAGTVYYDDVAMKNAITDRIIEWVDLDLDPQPMINFLESIMLNPSYQSREELILFLENNNLPIQEDGSFLAYKVVTSNFLDKHTRKIDNSIGATVEMDRGAVDDNRQNTCSSGLHFCSKEYIKSFMCGSDKLVLVAVNPADVVSIPNDYNNAKGRCCKYRVVSEVCEKQEFDSPLYTAPQRRIAVVSMGLCPKIVRPRYKITVTDPNGDGDLYVYTNSEDEMFEFDKGNITPVFYDTVEAAQSMFTSIDIDMLKEDRFDNYNNVVVAIVSETGAIMDSFNLDN